MAGKAHQPGPPQREPRRLERPHPPLDPCERRYLKAYRKSANPNSPGATQSVPRAAWLQTTTVLTFTAGTNRERGSGARVVARLCPSAASSILSSDQSLRRFKNGRGAEVSSVRGWPTELVATALALHGSPPVKRTSCRSLGPPVGCRVSTTLLERARQVSGRW